MSNSVSSGLHDGINHTKQSTIEVASPSKLYYDLWSNLGKDFKTGFNDPEMHKVCLSNQEILNGRN